MRERRNIRWQVILITANCAAILSVAIGFRLWELGNLPGVNGDEAWGGVQVLRLLHGEAFAWRTPTGNPLNPFFFLPQLALHAIFAPSFTLLRTTSAISGLLALAVNYWLCRKVFGRLTALVSTLVLAVLPINIAYSRFAWDASQSVLVTIPVLYLPLLAIARPQRFLRYAVLALLALAAAVLVHPTNVFAAPLVVVPLLMARWNAIRELLPRLTTAGGIMGCAAGLAIVLGPAHRFGSWIERAFNRCTSPAEWLQMCLNYLRLLSGTAVYQFISGSIPEPAAGPLWRELGISDALAAVVMAVALVGFVRLLRDRSLPLDLAVATGTASVLLGFYLVAGPQAIAPHFERYGMCLIAPGVLVIARGASWWISSPGRFRPAVLTTAGLMAWLLLLSFYVNYFQTFHATGGQSHRTFRTAAVEPKKQALECILAKRDATHATWILTDEWWTYWAISYLAFGHDNVRVVQLDPGAGYTPSDATFVRKSDSDRAAQVWYVGFTCEHRTGEYCRQLQVQHGRVEETFIRDFAGRPLMTVAHPTGIIFPE